jgi:hypothetical protein
MKGLIITELNQLLLQIPAAEKRFGADDIRTGFLDGHFSMLRGYYCAYFQIDSQDILLRYHEIYKKTDFTMADIAHQRQGHKNILNSFLIIQSWSNFELFITLFAEAVLSEEKKKELLETEYLRIKGIIKTNPPSDSEDLKLKKLTKHHLAHASMPHKYGSLLKLIADYPNDRNKENDRRFLEFYGRLRNCIHSNYIYFGRESSEDVFNGDTFKFTSGELISQQPGKEDTFLMMALSLKAIALLLMEKLPFDKSIYDKSNDMLK